MQGLLDTMRKNDLYHYLKQAYDKLETISAELSTDMKGKLDSLREQSSQKYAISRE